MITSRKLSQQLLAFLRGCPPSLYEGHQHGREHQFDAVSLQRIEAASTTRRQLELKTQKALQSLGSYSETKADFSWVIRHAMYWYLEVSLQILQ